MNASTILAIPLDEPERLFKVKERLREEYLALVKHWHPDVCRDSNADHVFAHIQALYSHAQDKCTRNLWHPFGSIEIKSLDGKIFRIAYRAKRIFELGEIYIGDKLITFNIARAHEKLVLNGLKRIGTLRYPTEDFRKNMEAYFPKVEKYIDTNDSIVICIRKDENEVLLADLIKYVGGQLDPKHAAWVMSRLYNLACFLELNKMTVNGITVHSVFVSPKKHSASILGGFWYAREVDRTISSLPPDVYNLAPRMLLINKKATPFLDLECIKAIGRTCLGDRTGNSLRMRSDIPKAMANFLIAPSDKSALADYETWDKVLTDSFGPKKFIKLEVGINDIYPKGD